MGPVGHVLVSSAVGGGVWAATGSPAAAAVAVGVGVLTDLDHLYDYYQRYARRKHGKFYVFWHGWEYPLVGFGLVASGFHHPIFLAALLAHLVHLVSDQWYNGLRVLGYSLAFRVSKGFNWDLIAPRRDGVDGHHRHFKYLEFDRSLGMWCRSKARQWLIRKTNGRPSDRAAAHYSDD